MWVFWPWFVGIVGILPHEHWQPCLPERSTEVADIEMEEVLRARRDSEESGRDSADSGDSGSGSGSDDEDSEACGQEGGALGRQDLFDRLMQECCYNLPGECFSAEVREEIERLSTEERRALVSRTWRDAPPLFGACARGNLALAQYLLRTCGAALEQRGNYRTAGAQHRVTPLWVAAVQGRMDVLKALADAGAALDAGSDSGSTPLRSACYVSHLEVARFLLARGADVNAVNHNGGTCLVNAVQSAELCRLLIDAGAEVNAQDWQLKTALHHAVQEYRVETTHLLLAAGADSRLTTRDGDDALQIACMKGAVRLVPTLLREGGWGAAREADAYELLGATFQDANNDTDAALGWWRAACAVRDDPRRPGGRVPKRPVRAPAAALRHTREWSSLAELEARADDADWIRTQALLVAERVLGPDHKDTLFRLMNRGVAYADEMRSDRCVALWMWVLELRIRKDTLLHTETCQTLLALTRLLLDVTARREEAHEEEWEREWQRQRQGEGAEEVGSAALQLLRLLVSPPALPECQRLLSVQPACRVQGVMFDRALRCAVHLVHVVQASVPGLHPVHVVQASVPGLHPDPDFEADYRHQISALVGLEARTTASGDSLLHLACSRLNVVRSTYFTDEMSRSKGVFPSAGVAQLLLQCGASVSHRNRKRCTPLHIAAISYNCSSELVETLLEWGAHLDQPNRFGDSPAELLQQSPHSRVRPLQHVTLACRAARVLMRHVPHSLPQLAARLPRKLLAFLELHV